MRQLVTMPEAKKAAQMYAEGIPHTHIAREFGRSRKAIRTALRLLGVQMRDRSEAQKKRESVSSPTPRSSKLNEQNTEGGRSAGVPTSQRSES